MPGFVQHYTESGYGYVDPWVGQVRNAVPLIDASVRRIEPYIPPVIRTTDGCIDSAYATAQKQVVFMRGKKAEVGVKVLGIREATTTRVKKMCGDSVILCYLHDATTTVFDKSESLVDWLLPPTKEELETLKSKTAEERGLVMRAVQIPMQIPIRVTRIVVLKVSDLFALLSAYTASTRQYAGEQKVRLVDFTTSNYNEVSTRVGGAVESGKNQLSKRRDEVQQKADALIVWSNGQMTIVATRLRLPEAQAWTALKVEGVKQTSLTLADQVVGRAFNMATSAAGEERATALFQKINLPVAEKSKQT